MNYCFVCSSWSSSRFVYILNADAAAGLKLLFQVTCKFAEFVQLSPSKRVNIYCEITARFHVDATQKPKAAMQTSVVLAPSLSTPAS